MGRVEAWIATYSGGLKYLDETVESLREQGIEPVIINDERLPHEKWNEALERCSPDCYLALPHSDDIYMPGWATELSAYLDAHPDVVAVFCLDYLIDPAGKRIGQTYPAWHEQDSYTFKDLFDLDMRHGNTLRCETVMLNRRLVGEMRYPDRTISGTAHDTQFWYELASKHPIGIVMKPLVKYRVHPESDTQRNVVSKLASSDGFKARLYASTLRPQDVEFSHVIALTKHLEANREHYEADRVRKRQGNGCEFLVCHEPPDAAGTGVVVAHRVRTLNAGGEGPIRFYVYPTQGKEIEVAWERGVPAVRCPAEAFGDAFDKLKPSKIEYHHLLKWPLDILNAPCPEKELWLHDSFLWCARYHSVMPDGTVCNTPTPKGCAECSGEAKEFIEKKKAALASFLPQMGRVIANSAYTAEYARINLGISQEIEICAPSGAPLVALPRRKRVGYFGGFGVVKGTPVLLKAWRVLQKQSKEPIRFTFNDDRPTLSKVHIPKECPQLLMFCDVPAEWKDGRKLAGFDDVLVMGAYHRNDLPDLCNLVDLAVVPSINESYGMVKRELESLGVVVIATKTGGLDGDVPPGDAVALAEAIRAAL